VVDVNVPALFSLSVTVMAPLPLALAVARSTMGPVLDCAVWQMTEAPFSDVIENGPGAAMASPPTLEISVLTRKASPVLIMYSQKSMVRALVLICSVPRPLAEQQVKLPPGADVMLLMSVPAALTSKSVPVIAAVPSEVKVPAIANRPV
jgi:hypothetical protein